MIKFKLWLLAGFLLSNISFGRSIVLAPGSFYSNTWQQAQIMHLQTQQQLQAQDIYSRQLLIADQQRQLDRIAEQQRQQELVQHSLIMREHSNLLRMYSRALGSGVGKSWSHKH